MKWELKKEKSQKLDSAGKTKEGYFFTEDELYSFVTDCFQKKAEYDGTNYTPQYEVNEFLRSCGWYDNLEK